MKNTQYVFVDSGVGGLPYLEHLRTVEKNVNAVYIADIKNFPYGVKNKTELQELAIKLIEKIIKKFNPKIVVLACNTLSVSALQTLRENFSIPFVGTVPAVKPAAKKTKRKKIVLIASEKSVKDYYTKNLIEKFSSPENFILKAEQDLICKVEAGLLFASDAEKEKAVTPIINYCLEQGADCLVLACTHFLVVKNIFQKVSKGKIKIIDSVEGVIKQVLKLSPAQMSKENSGEAFFYVTGNLNEAQKDYYKKISKYYNLTFGGSL